MSDDGDKLSQSVKAIAADTETMLDALMDLIERMSVGNPRLLKAERKAIARFAHILTDQLGAQVFMLQSHDSIRLRMRKTQAQWERIAQLDKRIKQQNREILGIVRDLIEQRRYDDALDLISRVLRGPLSDEPDDDDKVS